MFLRADELSRSFGGVQALKQVSFAFVEGQIGALIGPNGAGKTTLFDILTGFLPPTSGSVQFRGQPLNGLSCQQIAGLGIARTFQNLQLFTNMTVLENVMVGCHGRGRGGLLAAALKWPARREEAWIRATALEMLKRVGLAGQAETPADALPFGQKRLLEIARALAMKPSLLLLDEPAAGLNRVESATLVELIRRIRAGGTSVVLVEHDMETVMELAEHIVVLDFGRKIAEGSPGEISLDERVIAAYLGQEATPGA